MSTFYRVDLNGNLTAGATLDLALPLGMKMNAADGMQSLYGGAVKDDLQRHIEILAPGGMTDQGEYYLAKSEASCNFQDKAKVFLAQCSNLNQARAGIQRALDGETNSVIDLVFEYVRRSHFPERPSRYASVFAWKTLKEAEAFRQLSKRGAIWEIEPQNDHGEPFAADMNLCALDGSTLVFSYLAHRYWNGLTGPKAPCWEVLLTPPVKVLRQMTAA